MQTPNTDIKRRHDFVLYFDVTDGNPNGDPDAGNLPRVDPETMQGLVTDVCLKRKVRDYVDMIHGEEARYKIYVQDKHIALNTLHERAYKAEKKQIESAQGKWEKQRIGRDWMCQNFYDVRMFGAVMTTGDHNCGQVRGPIQLTFARSQEPIVPLDICITRITLTTPAKAETQQGTMGRKALVPYGLYRAQGFYNPFLARQTGVQQEDLQLFWQALQNMWEYDRSASRGFMACRGIYVFSHESGLGNAPAHKLFARVTASKKPDVNVPRSFSDYVVGVDDADLPKGIDLAVLAT